MSANSKGTMKVSPIERITLAAFRLADANRAYRKALKERSMVDDGGDPPCWKHRPRLLTSEVAEFCETCTAALPILRKVQTTYRERARAKAYFWKAVAAVKSPRPSPARSGKVG